MCRCPTTTPHVAALTAPAPGSAQAGAPRLPPRRPTQNGGILPSSGNAFRPQRTPIAVGRGRRPDKSSKRTGSNVEPMTRPTRLFTTSAKPFTAALRRIRVPVEASQNIGRRAHQTSLGSCSRFQIAIQEHKRLMEDSTDKPYNQFRAAGKKAAFRLSPLGRRSMDRCALTEDNVRDALESPMGEPRWDKSGCISIASCLGRDLTIGVHYRVDKKDGTRVVHRVFVIQEG